MRVMNGAPVATTARPPPATAPHQQIAALHPTLTYVSPTHHHQAVVPAQAYSHNSTFLDRVVINWESEWLLVVAVLSQQFAALLLCQDCE